MTHDEKFLQLIADMVKLLEEENELCYVYELDENDIMVSRYGGVKFIELDKILEKVVY